jgi:hypothetical protein
MIQKIIKVNDQDAAQNIVIAFKHCDWIKSSKVTPAGTIQISFNRTSHGCDCLALLQDFVNAINELSGKTCLEIL